MTTVKDERQIRKRLRQLMYRAFQKKARQELKVVPPNCVFNRETSTLFPDGRPFRVCGLALDQEPRQVLDCNTPPQAAACKSFVHHTDKQAVKDNVERVMRDPETGPQQYPDVSALMWTLDEDERSRIGIEEPTRWERVVAWLRRLLHRSAP